MGGNRRFIRSRLRDGLDRWRTRLVLPRRRDPATRFGGLDGHSGRQGSRQRARRAAIGMTWRRGRVCADVRRSTGSRRRTGAIERQTAAETKTAGRDRRSRAGSDTRRLCESRSSRRGSLDETRRCDTGAMSHGRPTSRWSLLSEDSFISIGSKGSILSIGSVGSILSLGSIGSACSVLSIGSFGSLGSIMSSRSRWSLMSEKGRRAVMQSSSVRA